MHKENPNPTIHETRKSNHPSNSLSARHFLGSGEIRRYHLGGSPSPLNSLLPHFYAAASECHSILPDEAEFSYRWGLFTAEERSVALALSDAAYHPSSTQSSSVDSTAAPKLDILQHAGFALYHPQHIQKQCATIRYPSFTPSNSHIEQNYEVSPGKSHVEELKRDKFTENEVFQIIRNIQDPEHPLTLEQLNVVRLELIDVVDLKGDDADGSCSSEANGSTTKKFSTVHVQFT